MKKDNKTLRFDYKFVFKDKTDKNFTIKLDSKTLDLIHLNKRNKFPSWTKLPAFKCPCCTLDEKKVKYCPTITSLIELIESFKDLFSYDKVYIYIDTTARQYTANTTLQNGLSSLIGIYMVTSGCPIMSKLKPMVRYHLPFATMKETNYRAISMYLIAQYLRHKHGKKPDWNLNGLIKIYADVKEVNRNFSEKLGSLEINDSILNALVRLDCFANFVALTLNRELLDELELTFSSYLS